MISSKKSLPVSVGSHGGSTGSGQTTSVSSTAASISDLSSYDAKSTCSSSTTTTLSASQHGAADDGEEDLQHHSKHHHTNSSVDKESKMPSTMDNSASSSSSGEKAKRLVWLLTIRWLRMLDMTKKKRKNSHKDAVDRRIPFCPCKLKPSLPLPIAFHEVLFILHLFAMMRPAI
jgi:hypothetical protein